MQFSIDDLEIGYHAGIERSRSKFSFDFPPIDKSTRPILEECLNIWPYQCSPHFVRLFSELVITASIARSINAEAPLSIDDVISFLGASASFFNSFKHK